MHAHADLALSLQVPQSVLGYNGAVIRLDGADPKVVGEVTAGYIAVDGTSLLPSDGPVMRLRRKIRDDGVVFVSLMVDDKGQVEDVRVSAPGLLDEIEDEEWLDELAEAVADAVEAKGKRADSKQREDAVRHTIRRLFQKEFDKKPVVQAHLLGV